MDKYLYRYSWGNIVSCWILCGSPRNANTSEWNENAICQLQARYCFKHRQGHILMSIYPHKLPCILFLSRADEGNLNPCLPKASHSTLQNVKLYTSCIWTWHMADNQQADNNRLVLLRPISDWFCHVVLSSSFFVCFFHFIYFCSPTPFMKVNCELTCALRL